MNEYISVEMGRALLAGNEIVVEFGRALYKDDTLPDLTPGSSLMLDTRFAPDGAVLVSVYVNGKLAAKGRPGFSKEHGMTVTVAELLDDGAGLTVGQVIPLTQTDPNAPQFLTVTVNGIAKAHGKINRGLRCDICNIIIM